MKKRDRQRSRERERARSISQPAKKTNNSLYIFKTESVSKFPATPPQETRSNTQYFRYHYEPQQLGSLALTKAIEKPDSDSDNAGYTVTFSS